MPIEVRFYDAVNETSTVDYFEGTVDELIIDLLTDEWPYTFVSATDRRLNFVRINTNDEASFEYRK